MLPRILILHGLNNSLDAFGPLKAALTERGFDCKLVCLPGHADDREEVREFVSANSSFDRAMSALTNSPYAVIAFSQGALYFQLWLRQTLVKKPIAQVLLAPAISIRYFDLLNRLSRLLPLEMTIKSQLPESLRRYSYLYVREYRILFDAQISFRSEKKPFVVPTLVLIDPKDELVNAQKLKSEYPEQVVFIERPYLRGKKPGKYHAIFHPEYFTVEDWEKMLGKISGFLKI